LQRKTQLKDAAFIQAYKILKAESFYDKMAEALNLEPKTSRMARAATAGKHPAKKPPAVRSEKTKKRAAVCRARVASK